MTVIKKPAKSRRNGEAVPSLMDLVPPSAKANPEKPVHSAASKALTTAHRGVRGRPWTNIRALAKEHSVEALEKLIELKDCDNDCVSFGATRMVFELGNGRVPTIIEHVRSGGAHSGKDKPAQELKIQIKHFKEEGKGGTATRHRKLPLVPGRREGSRHARHGTGKGLRTLRGQRPGVCDEPGIGHGPAPGVQGGGSGPSAQGSRAGINTRTRTDESVAEDQTPSQT